MKVLIIKDYSKLSKFENIIFLILLSSRATELYGIFIVMNFPGEVTSVRLLWLI